MAYELNLTRPYKPSQTSKSVSTVQESLRGRWGATIVVLRVRRVDGHRGT